MHSKRKIPQATQTLNTINISLLTIALRFWPFKFKTMYGNALKIAVNATCGKYFNKIGLPHVYIALFRCLWVPGGGLEPFRRVLRSDSWLLTMFTYTASGA